MTDEKVRLRHSSLPKAAKDFAEAVADGIGWGFGDKKKRIVEAAFEAGARWQKKKTAVMFRSKPSANKGEKNG